jgi:hypothetical protein
MLIFLTQRYRGKREKYMKFRYNVTRRRVRETMFQIKNIRITYSECVFESLDMQRAMHMHHAVTCTLSVPLHFATLSHKPHNILNNVPEYKMCLFIFVANFV